MEYEISEIQLPTYFCNTYYICTCRWHSYIRCSATNIFLHIELILMPQNFRIFLRIQLSGHSSCFFGYSTHPWETHNIQTFSPNLLVDMPQMLWKFCIFHEHLPEHQGCLFSDIPHISRTCITLISDISDLQLPNLFVHVSLMLWMFRIFPGHLPEHQGCVFEIFRTLPEHVLHVVYLFQILRTMSNPFICAHSPDALEVPHFFQDIDLSTGAVFFWIFWTLPGHVLHLTYLFRIFRTLSTSFICACSRSSAFF